MIWKLLRKNISVAQILGYALANLIGLVIVLSALRFYGDVAPTLQSDSKDSALTAEDFMVISKPVTLLNTFGRSAPGFSASDIEDIAAQPWVGGVGEFASADFNVAASVELGGRGMQTYLFLESIPDEFIDISPSAWKFNPQDIKEIPIILAKDYLALYNYGFATSRGLPQLSESLISQVPITLLLSGNGRVDRFQARIVGFSSRLNTIAVPAAFMQWANERYSGDSAKAPSRLIVKVNSPGDPAINEYFERQGYEVAGDKLDTGQAAYFLTLLTSIVITIGVIITLLALFVLMLSLHLLLQKNKEKVSTLLLLGYSPMQVSMGYFRLVGFINVAVLILGVAGMMIASAMWEKKLAVLGIHPSSLLLPILAAIIIMTLITAINFLSIYRTVLRSR